MGARALPWNGFTLGAIMEGDVYGIYIVVGVLGAVWLFLTA